MPNVFFKIANTDLTRFEDIQNHAVDREDIFETWTDGNWIDHRVIVRTRISGKVTLGFSDAADFTAFVNLMQTAKTADGYYPVTVYCRNTGTTETFNAFLDVAGGDKWDLKNGRQWQTATVTITGR